MGREIKRGPITSEALDGEISLDRDDQQQYFWCGHQRTLLCSCYGRFSHGARTRCRDVLDMALILPPTSNSSNNKRHTTRIPWASFYLPSIRTTAIHTDPEVDGAQIEMPRRTGYSNIAQEATSEPQAGRREEFRRAIDRARRRKYGELLGGGDYVDGLQIALNGPDEMTSDVIILTLYISATQ